MEGQDALSSLILQHWSRYQPKMLAELRRENRLQRILDETTERFADLLYELVSVRKMQYHQAWETAIDQILQPEDQPST